MTDRVLAARNNQANNKNIFSQIDKSKSDPAYAYQLWKLFSKCKQIDEPNKKLLQSNKGNSAEHTDYCYQFDLNENVDINEFLYLAAKGGIPQAAVEYFNTAFMNFDDSHQNSKKSTQFADAIEAMQFLNNAADGGLPDAMIMISGIYQTGSLVEKDYEKAYSYEYAANRSGIFSNRDKILDIISTHLTADQLRSASKKGEEIFRNCCME